MPTLCGNISDLQLFNGHSTLPVIDSYQSSDDTMGKAFFKSHFLLPFPNRLKDGRFFFEGKSYQFPINDTNNHHGLHGFLSLIPLNFIAQKTVNDICEIDLKGQFKGLPHFPFPFEIEIKYTLSNTNLTIKTTIKNIGKTNMPIGFGWHPYFKLDTNIIDNLELKLPDCKLVKIDKRMMPTGKVSTFDTFAVSRNINKTHFDNCFLLNKNTAATRAEIILKSKTTTLSFWQETGENACPYFQIYTPDDRKTIAIEPMTCNVDALNNGDGLWVLSAGEARTVQFGVKV